MRKVLLFIVSFWLLYFMQVKAQNVGIGSSLFTPDASAGLEIQFSDKGLLIPRVSLTSTSSAAPITSPATSLLVYNTATTGDVTPGYYYWNGSKWMRLLSINDKPAWLLSGNAGTTPTTNFLGTTDAQPLVIRTNNTERSRILSNGQVLINKTTADYSFDLLEVQGNATYPFAINGLTNQASGAGVYGYNSASRGIGVWGEAYNGVRGNGLFADGIGVVGNISATAGTGTGLGVLALSNQDGGQGVQAQHSRPAGDAIWAVNTASSGTNIGCGIYARTSQSNGFGVWGANAHTSGTGVVGAGNNVGPSYLGNGSGGAFSSTNVGVFGYGDITSDSWGVLGISAATDGTGVVGAGNNQTASHLTDGSGGAFTGSKTGSYSIAKNSTGTGVIGVGNNQTSSTLTKGSGGAFIGDSIGVYGKATKSGNGTWGGYFVNGTTNVGYAYVGGRDNNGTNRKVWGNGTVSTIVKNTAGELVSLSCPEAPEIYFQDYGEGQLVNGKAHIELDPDFALNVTINEKHPLRVFIQLEDDCQGVYVTNKTKTGFDVIELNGGSSNAKFMWTVTANRADELDENGNIISKYADVRFAPAPGPLKTLEIKEEKANNKEIMGNIRDIKDIKVIESIDKNNININKTNNQ